MSLISVRACILVAVVLCVLSPPALAEDLSRFEVQRAHMMLNIIKKDLAKYYYDEGFHGIQLDESFQRASDRVDQAKSISQLFAAISRCSSSTTPTRSSSLRAGRRCFISGGR